MREARTRVGLIPEGEILLTYRAPNVPGVYGEEDMSFGKWGSEDPLPSYNDHITGYTLASPPDETASTTPERPEDWPSYRPSHPSFGPPSVVMVPRPWGGNNSSISSGVIRESEQEETNDNREDQSGPERPRRTTRSQPSLAPFGEQPVRQQKRRPVKERWFYEPVERSKAGLITHVGHRNLGGGDEMVVEVGDKEEQKFLVSKNRKTITNWAIPDQSECTVGEKKLLDEVFDFVEDDVRPDKFSLSTFPVINFNLEEKPIDDFTGSVNVLSNAPTIVPDQTIGAYLESADNRITNDADPLAQVVSSPDVMLFSALGILRSQTWLLKLYQSIYTMPKTMRSQHGIFKALSFMMMSWVGVRLLTGEWIMAQILYFMHQLVLWIPGPMRNMRLWQKS
jgi:hypothetical protein